MKVRLKDGLNPSGDKHWWLNPEREYDAEPVSDELIRVARPPAEGVPEELPRAWFDEVGDSSAKRGTNA